MKIVSSENWTETAEAREALRPCWERAVVIFPERPSDAARLEAFAALTPGYAAGAVIRVARDGGVEASAIGLGTGMAIHAGKGDPAALSALLAYVCPGLGIASDCPTSGAWLPAALLVPQHEDTHNSLLLAPPVHDWPWDLEAALAILAADGGGILVIAVRNLPRDKAVSGLIADAHSRTLGATYARQDERQAHSSLAGVVAMRDDPALFAIEVRLDTSGASNLLRDLVSMALFGRRAGREARSGELDLRCLAGSCHAPVRFLPTAREVEALTAAQVSIPEIGLIVGIAGGGQAIALSENDRARHSYIIGATGTGKSTLLKSLIAQDISAGEGVVLIDPHGDIANDVAWLVPPERRADLVFADAADPAGGFAIGLIPASDDEDARELAADSLVELFSGVLYKGVPEAIGPIFEQYFRQALFLLIHADPENRLLANLPRIFQEPGFRRELLGRCTDRNVRDFWTLTAIRTTGDIDLTNVTPYITSKLTRFIGTALGRRLFPSNANSIDFRAAIDSGKILILRCPKGDLGEGLASLAMSAAVLKLRDALAARAAVGRASRRPVRLYIDEFQACRGTALQTLLAEGRKFGVTVTLANQSLGQVGGVTGAGIGAAALANAGNLFVFRVGAPDAVAVAPWFEQPDRWRAFCRQPDFRMSARILANGKPVTLSGLRTPANRIPGAIV